MTGLDQGEREVLEARRNRLTQKEMDFQVSRNLADYIDKLEGYLLELEERVVSLETMLGLRGLEPPQYK